MLVHGDWADGSSWNTVIARLQARGYTVVAPPNPLRGPTDAPYLAAFLASVTGPIVLVAHSYGGFVITNAATGNTNVKALVYIDAFIPDEGQVPGDLNPGSCLDAATAFRVVPVPGDVDLYLQAAPNGPYQGFEECFANGVNRRDAAVLFATQRPASVAQVAFVSGPPAWADDPGVGADRHRRPGHHPNGAASHGRERQRPHRHRGRRPPVAHHPPQRRRQVHRHSQRRHDLTPSILASSGHCTGRTTRRATPAPSRPSAGSVPKDGDRGSQLVHEVGASMARREVFLEGDAVRVG